MTILNELQINQRKTVVEFRSGLSTIYMAKVLEARGGSLTSIEHDPGWAEIVRQWIAHSRLEPVARIVVAPLAPCHYSLDNNPWYDQAKVAEAIAHLAIDCVLVDGPPAHTPGRSRARYPAFEAVEGRLSDRYVIFLDDIGRGGEQEILARWSARAGISFEMMPARGGIARGVKGAAYYSAI
jgi:predicted O-methyltransferase YrrM